MLVLLPSNWCANWWIQNNTVGESCHLEVSEFFHLDIQIFAHLQKNFVIFTPVEYRKIFLANCLDFNQPGKTGVFTNMVIHYTSVMEKMPRTNILVRKIEHFCEICKSEMKILSTKASNFHLILLDNPRIKFINDTSSNTRAIIILNYWLAQIYIC